MTTFSAFWTLIENCSTAFGAFKGQFEASLAQIGHSDKYLQFGAKFLLSKVQMSIALHRAILISILFNYLPCNGETKTLLRQIEIFARDIMYALKAKMVTFGNEVTLI